MPTYALNHEEDITYFLKSIKNFLRAIYVGLK